jgi:hypothetical protein
MTTDERATHAGGADPRATGAPTDLIGGMPATEESGAAPASTDPLEALGGDARGTLAAIAGHLIPEAHGMPSAADVVTDDRLRFVLGARPDLVEPLVRALRPELGDDIAPRLERLASDEPTELAALQLVIVAGYYSDGRVRELIGYPGQLAIPVDGDAPLLHVDPQLVENVKARGPVWRDPRTGTRAIGEIETPTSTPTYPQRTAAPRDREGGTDGRDGT